MTDLELTQLEIICDVMGLDFREALKGSEIEPPESMAREVLGLKAAAMERLEHNYRRSILTSQEASTERQIWAERGDLAISEAGYHSRRLELLRLEGVQ